MQQRLNQSPTQIRTLDCETRDSALGMNPNA